MHRKTRFKLGAAMGAFALVLGACSSGGGSPAQSGGPADSNDVVGKAVEVNELGSPVTIGLTYVPNVQFSPIYLAAEDDVFYAAGLATSIRHHGPDEGLFTALTNGEEDVTIASGDEVLQARAAGLDVVSIGAYYNKYPAVIITKAESDIETVEDLKGKQVGLPGEYGANWFGLLAALEAADMTTDDIDVVSIGFTQASALATDQVDAVVGFINSDAVQLEEMGQSIRIIQLSSEPVPLVGASIVTTQEWLDESPAVAASVVEAVVAGMDRVIANPQHALEATEKWDPGLVDPEVRKNATSMLKATIELWERADGRASAEQDLATWEEMAPFLASILDVDQESMKEEGAVTNDYVGS